MKSIFRSLLVMSLIITGSLSAKGKDPVLMYINDQPVLKSEFEYIYNKNNSNNTLDKKSLEEYVDLFINFKLKVEEAKAQGLDTTQSFIRELSGYRTQLTKPYMTDQKVEEAVLMEAFNRLKEDVEVSHILVRVDPNATPEDTLKAWNKIIEIQKRVATEDFNQVAKEVSEDESARENSGYIGWITGFRTVYPFENAAYATPVGTLSKPVRTPFGYHILKVQDRRESKGEILVSHIMLFTSEGEDNKNLIAAERIDSMYNALKAGADFAEMATTYSEDRGSANKAGELPWFGIGRMVQEFEKAAFALKEIGDFSAPVQSAYGWHIIKLLDRKALPGFESRKAEIERQVKRDERSRMPQQAFVEKLKKEYKFKMPGKKNVEVYYKLLENRSLADSAFQAEAAQLNKPMFRFAKVKLTQSDFSAYLKQNAHSSKVSPKDIIDEKINAYVEKELLAYENSQLEKKYSDFRLLMQEYHDGILLFEVSNNEVWEKASRDTEGLASFFARNKEKYSWDKPRFKGRVIQCKSEDIYNKAKHIVATQPKDSIDKHLRQLNDSVIHLKIDKGLFVQGDNKQVDFHSFKTGVQPEVDNNFPYVFVSGTMLNYTPEEYSDVRGLVTADYQEYLELKWIEELRKKYPVRIEEKVLKTIQKN